MECNLRTSSNVALDTATGLNLSAIVYYDLVGKNFNHLIDRGRRLSIKWVDESDLDAALKQTDKKEVEKAIEGEKIRVFYDTTDMDPFLNLNLSQEVKRILGDVK